MVPRLVHPDADRLLVVISDIEMGAGGPTDDFPHSEWLGELLLSYTGPPYEGLAVELVFAGDTFDLLKTSWEGAYPRHVTAEVALGKLGRVVKAHPAFFEALRCFLRQGGGDRRIHFVVGNHDLELLFPEVQAALHRLLDDDPRVTFPGLHIDIGDVHIEHGHQADPMFRIEEPFFLTHHEERLLALPWAAVALLDVALPLQPILYHHDRLRPRHEVFALLPDVHEAVVNAFWTYWTRDWARSLWLRDDPLRRVSWTMLREVAYRFRTGDGEVSIVDQYARRLREPGATRVFVTGHEHRPTWLSWADRKFLMTGAFRNEYMLEDQGRVQRPLPKTYAEIFQSGHRTVRSHLVEVDGPPPPEGYVPDSIFNVLDAVQAHLQVRTAQERRQLAVAQDQQAAREADSTEAGSGGASGEE